jgi:hypothetical protein
MYSIHEIQIKVFCQFMNILSTAPATNGILRNYREAYCITYTCIIIIIKKENGKYR